MHAIAVGQELAQHIQGNAAMAVEVGSANRTVIKLLRAGLNSREAAITSVALTGATFIDHAGMLEWLSSEPVKLHSSENNWPTAQSHHAWLQFFNNKMNGDQRRLTNQTNVVQADWFIDVPPVSTPVIVEPDAKLILTTDFMRIGLLRTELNIPSRNIVNAWVGDSVNSVVVEYFGPSTG